MTLFSLLIVDDHKHLAESMALTIPWERYEVTRVLQAYSGTEAVEALQDGDIHILLTDIRMPGMSGLELIERAQKLAPGIDCILLTGHTQFEYAKRAVELQAIDYLVKPVRHEELLRVVETIIQRRKARLREQAELELLYETNRHLPQLRADLLAAKTDAELAVLEERDRIAGDIHDIVGHTLTATLMQIEAAKLLLARGEREGMQRLEKSQQLLRKSLDGIREAVGMIKKPDDADDLETGLQAFIEEAKHTANIAIDYRIELASPVTDPDLCKVLSHALREGVTNGIRHGGSLSFRFQLIQRGGLLRFSLWNDGTPYDGQSQGTGGLGLTAMRERIVRLGGTMRLVASAEPPGTLLELRIPLC
ncbi:response regulator [Paenibacillus ginsengarvi]|uniref:histidine kinase n=1 Tax=Paenibacillus ginsengarvi TaxID=400777 RepID=A0A3B0B268_9BACL|nr:response regulator [Paenibacillus ginsengarvi]RKN66071.1 response regulator [Paenibacillus ginsengarvi]